MKPDKNKDITEHFAEMLKEHSLPYKEGAWERFKGFEDTKKRKVVLWPYFIGAAAAIVLFVMSLFLFVGEDSNIEKQIVKQEDVEEVISKPNASLGDSNEMPGKQRVASLVEQPKERFIGLDVSSELISSNIDIESFAKIDAPSLDSSSYNDTSKIQEPPSIASTQPAEQSNSSLVPKDLYTSPSYIASEPLSSNPLIMNDTKRWDFSVELSPNIKDNNVNFGGGVAVAYNLSDRISIGSGVSYMHLDAERSPNKIDIPVEFTNLGGSNKSLNTISTSLVGLDIPLNLKMNMGSAMYINAGVSVFSVLNESRYNNFEERITVTALASPSFSPSSDRKETSGVEARSLYSQEVSVSTPYEGKNFTGFFNFSVGYKLPFFPKMNLAVEPYFKVPIGSLSDQDMNLNNGGFKIKASF